MDPGRVSQERGSLYEIVTIRSRREIVAGTDGVFLFCHLWCALRSAVHLPTSSRHNRIVTGRNHSVQSERPVPHPRFPHRRDAGGSVSEMP